MDILESNKALSMTNFDRLVITSVKNPITGRYSFLVMNEKSNQALITDSLVIDGVKLIAG